MENSITQKQMWRPITRVATDILTQRVVLSVLFTDHGDPRVPFPVGYRKAIRGYLRGNYDGGELRRQFDAIDDARALAQCAEAYNLETILMVEE